MRTTMTNNQKGTIYTLIGGSCWGLSGVCAQYLFDRQNACAEWLVPIRLLVAGTGMLLWFLLRDRKGTLAVWKHRRDAIDLLIYGLAGITLCQYTFFATIQRSSAGTATVLQYLAPVLIMILVCATGRKLPKLPETVAMLCAVAGVFLLATHGNPGELVISKGALAYGLISCVCIVIYNVQPQRLMARFSTPMLLGWAMFLGGVVMTLCMRPWQYHLSLNANTLLALLAIIVLGTIVSFTCYMLGVKYVGPVKASLYGCVEPVLSTILSVMWLGSSFTGMGFLGFVLILSTVVLLPLGDRAAKKQTGTTIE